MLAKSPQLPIVPRWPLKPGAMPAVLFLCVPSQLNLCQALWVLVIHTAQEPPRKGFWAVREPCWSEQQRGFEGLQMGAGFPWQLLLPGLPGSRIGTLRTQGYSIPHLSALQLPLNWVSEASLQAKPPAPWMPGCPSPYPVPLFISFGLQHLPSCTTLLVKEISRGENREG